MFSPKYRPQVTKEEEGGSCCSLRCCLLIWAVLRLVVSLFSSGSILFATFVDDQQYILVSGEYSPSIDTKLWFYVFVILMQLVESVMIVIFITAGVKKSFSLYRVYYYYCILTLIIYVIAVGLYSTLDFNHGHFFGEVYLTFYLSHLLITVIDFNIAFMLLAAIDVVAEVLLIFLIRELIKIYSFKPCETV